MWDIPEGDCDCDGNKLDALDVCGGDCAADADADGICDDVDDCVGAYDECGICNGPGAIYECGCADIPEGDRLRRQPARRLGRVWDCAEDLDADGICDDVDDCVGAYDECGICNGPGAIYECGCADIPEGDCDCDATVSTPWACGGDCAEDANDNGLCDVDEVTGCTDSLACNYNEGALTTALARLWTVCGDLSGGLVLANDEDGDGVCDADETLGCTDPLACNGGFFTDTDNTLWSMPMRIVKCVWAVLWQVV